MSKPSAAAMRHMSRHPMPRYSEGVATRGRPILADTANRKQLAPLVSMRGRPTPQSVRFPTIVAAQSLGLRAACSP